MGLGFISLILPLKPRTTHLVSFLRANHLVSLPRLTKFSVAFNQLTGAVPNFNLKFGRESFSSNKGLCGQPMDPCVDPEEDVVRVGKNGAAIGAALFAPLGVFLDWFVFSGRKKKQGDRRHRSWIFHIYPIKSEVQIYDFTILCHWC
ncbi:hypothetical protein N665_0224s0023 [Sinapis alba]|nr:hypothetical protein N665_0224s0023 [Sinapis alba]